MLEALKERQTVEALAKTYQIHPTQITAWKKEFLSKAGSVFDAKDPAAKTGEPHTEQLYAQIGQLKVENDFLKKKLF